MSTTTLHSQPQTTPEEYGFYSVNKPYLVTFLVGDEPTPCAYVPISPPLVTPDGGLATMGFAFIIDGENKGGMTMAVVPGELLTDLLPGDPLDYMPSEMAEMVKHPESSPLLDGLHLPPKGMGPTSYDNGPVGTGMYL